MIPVVFSTDHSFIMPTGVAIFSMLESNKEYTFDIFLIQSEDVSDEDRQCLFDLVKTFSSRITFINPGDYFSNSYEIRDISYACYFRLLIPWLIPQYDKIIYLDGDIIVKSNLSTLLDVANNENMLVYGIRTPGFTLETEFTYHINSLDLDSHKYINSGVLVFNSKLMRELKLKDRFLSYTTKQFLFQDQDIINLVCKNKIGWLPLKFNSSPTLGKVKKNELVKEGITTDVEFDEALINPVIIHYAGPKPWKTFTYHWYDWWSVYSRSPFFDFEYAYIASSKIMDKQFTIKQIIRMLANKILLKKQ